MPPSDHLHPPGKILYVYSQDNQKYDTMEESAPSLFFDIILSSTMFTDHMPDLYESSLLNVVERLEKEAGVTNGKHK